MLPTSVWKQHVLKLCGNAFAFGLLSLETCLAHLHTLWPLPGQAGRFLWSVSVLGEKKRIGVCPSTVHWTGMNLAWNPCRQTIDTEAVLLKAGKMSRPTKVPASEICSLPCLKLDWNEKRVQLSFDGSTFSHCYCPKAELQTSNCQAMGWQQPAVEDELPSVGGCMLICA